MIQLFKQATYPLNLLIHGFINRQVHNYFSSTIYTYLSISQILKRAVLINCVRLLKLSLPCITNLMKGSAEKGKQRYVVTELSF